MLALTSVAIAKIRAASRHELWSAIIQESGARTVLELGVLTGKFAEKLLRASPQIERYIMLDPWRHLDSWNTPTNNTQPKFDKFFGDAMERTDFAKDRRAVLRGTTLEVIGQIEDASLDLAYVDGDHTLRGVVIDLIRVFPKVKDGGILGGDDFFPSIWEHPPPFEPTLVFPFAIHFAEAVGCPIVALPFNQFAIVKDYSGFRFIDELGLYQNTDISAQARPTEQVAVPSNSGRRSLWQRLWRN